MFLWMCTIFKNHYFHSDEMWTVMFLLYISSGYECQGTIRRYSPRNARNQGCQRWVPVIFNPFALKRSSIKLSSGPIILLIITSVLRMILQTVRRRVVVNDPKNISPSNIFPTLLFPATYNQSGQASFGCCEH